LQDQVRPAAAAQAAAAAAAFRAAAKAFAGAAEQVLLLAAVVLAAVRSSPICAGASVRADACRFSSGAWSRLHHLCSRSKLVTPAIVTPATVELKRVCCADAFFVSSRRGGKL
jgi:hypothetical protein